MAHRANLAALLQRPNAAAMPPLPALALPSWRRAFLALAVALLAQTTVLHDVHVRGGTISFVLLVVLWFAASAGAARGAFFGLIAGACEDAISGGTGAAWTVATPLAAALAARAVRAIGWDHPLFLGAVTAFAAFARTIVFWLVLQAERTTPNLDTPAVHAALWSAALDAAVAIVLTATLRGLRPPRVERV
jgi:rod shape-determining protein MreD